MNEQATVVCVLRTGAFKGRQYGPHDVRCLKAMVARNLSQDHRFVCLSNLDEIEGVEVLRLRYDLPGWWSKIELFGWNAGTRMLYLDLDVLVTGQLDPLVNYPAPIVFAPAIITKPKPKIVRRFQSSAMVWTWPAGREIFYKFGPSVMKRFRGDQDWMGHIAPASATFPASWFCKWRPEHGSGPPKDVKVMLVTHPLTNAMLAKRHGWVRRVWNDGELGVPQAHTENLERGCP